MKRRKKSPSRKRASVRYLEAARWTLGAVLAIAAVAMVAWTQRIVMASDALTLTNVSIDGAIHLEKEPLEDLILGAFPKQLLAIDLDRVRSLVEAENWVSTATVRRKLPGSLVVHVSEREPLTVAAGEERPRAAPPDVLRQVVPDGPAQECTLRPVALTVPDLQLPTLEIHVIDVEADGRAQADAGGKHEVE